MLNLTKKDIIIPAEPPELIIIVGPCRTGTTALANIFAKADITVYMQPIKSARRAKESEENNIPWEIEKEFVAVTKETLGAKTEAEFFDPVRILLDIGYPKEKLILIPIVRDPIKTLASWREMWNDLDIKKFIQSYKLILDIKRTAEVLGIKTIPYVHEAIRDNSPYVVVQKLFDKIGLKKRVSEDIINWKNSLKFGQDVKISSVKFYDIPPEKFVKEVRNWGEYKYREEPYLKLVKADLDFLFANKDIRNIYEEFRIECQSALGLKI